MYYTSYQLLGNNDIACALDEARQREVTRHNHNATHYVRMMHHHIDAAIYLSAQGLAFRGHDESSISSNRGNFIELLELLGNYSHEFRSFLDKERVTYTSHDPQNQLIHCIAEEVRGEIKKRLDDSRFVSVMMDDTSDTSNIEQSAVSIRLINNGEVEEHLLGLVDATDDQSADGLTEILKNQLRKYGITQEHSKEKLVGQSYDGAPTMSGELNGVQAQMQRDYPVAYYNHCAAHRFSLCASRPASKIPRVAKFFGTIDKLITFFRSSPKRARHLGHNLPKPGDTRWFSRDSAINVIDSSYEAIGTVLYELANENKEKAETQSNARGLGIRIQEVEFVFLLKLYRKIFEYSTPIINTMQRPVLDAVMVKSMLDDFLAALAVFDYDQIWKDALLADPAMPAVRTRDGWRNMEPANNGSSESWKASLQSLGEEITGKFSEQLMWRFSNLAKFKWMELIHPTKFEERRKATVRQQRALINDVQELYPFVVKDVLATEYNLSVLYHSTEIGILLQKLVRERDELVAKKKERRTKIGRMKDQAETTMTEMGASDSAESSEANEQFDVEENSNIEVDAVKEGTPTAQDLLTVIKKANLEDALPQVMSLLQLAVVTPLTSVHCERVFSRMKRVVSSGRSRMLQDRKENLVFLQVEHRLLRYLAGQFSFKDNVIKRFKAYNQRRYERFSKK